MKVPFITLLSVSLALLLGIPAQADCPLDHLIIGCNQDGIEGTADDKQLFFDCSQKYRDSGETEYAHWFYPLRKSIFPGYGYRIGEPGFDILQSENPHASYTYDPNRAPIGAPMVDYSLVVECVALSTGLRAVHKNYPQFTIAETGDDFCHSDIQDLRGDGHLHMSYQATDGNDLRWITFRVYDELEDEDIYEPSEPVTIVFNVEPPAGDLVVNGKVDVPDLRRLAHYWLAERSSPENDYCERADANRDGAVNMLDFALLASNWRNPPD